MAKADDTSTTIVWIWLRDALALAKASLGSEALAKQWLIEWQATGELLWDCMSWQGPDAPGLARLKRKSTVAPTPSSAYHKGDPQFWCVSGLEIDWEDNEAYAVFAADPARIRERLDGYGNSIEPQESVQALGLRVAQARLHVLLPGGVHENGDALRQTMPAERELLEPKAWLAWALKEYPQQRKERPTPYTRRLHGLMQKADNVTEVWKFETFRVRYYEAVKAER
jgi:hypothetical protein